MAEMVTAITGAVDFASVVTGIGAVGAALAVVYIAKKGLNMLLSSLRGG